MDELLKKVDELLRRTFPGATTELEAIPEESRVTGFVFWPGFEGQEQIDCQRSVWQMLRANLGPDEKQHVSAIFTLTPEEIEHIRQG